MIDKHLKPDEAVKAARREYQRRWRKNNPEKVKAAQERYWRRVYETQRIAPGIPGDAEIR